MQWLRHGHNRAALSWKTGVEVCQCGTRRRFFLWQGLVWGCGGDFGAEVLLHAGAGVCDWGARITTHRYHLTYDCTDQYTYTYLQSHLTALTNTHRHTFSLTWLHWPIHTYIPSVSRDYTDQYTQTHLSLTWLHWPIHTDISSVSLDCTVQYTQTHLQSRLTTLTNTHRHTFSLGWLHWPIHTDIPSVSPDYTYHYTQLYLQSYLTALITRYYTLNLTLFIFVFCICICICM